MKKEYVIILAVSAFLAAPAFAGSTDDPVIQRRQKHQEGRIEQGERSGQLTGREAARLERGQDKIGRDESRAKADGKITPKERRKLRREQNRASRQIFREKHDGQTQ